MQASETITKIAPAYLKAQTEITKALKDSSNPFFHSSYADLNSIMGSCKESLNKNGIGVLQPVVGEIVETILMHESGEWFSSETRIICKETNNPQAQGSAITYARRYGLQSMVFIGAEDDDGESATERPTHYQETKALKQTSGNTAHCSIHNAEMQERTSKKTGTQYFSHIEDGKHCFGVKSDQPKLAAQVMKPKEEPEITVADYDVSDSIPF